MICSDLYLCLPICSKLHSRISDFGPSCCTLGPHPLQNVRKAWSCDCHNYDRPVPQCLCVHTCDHHLRSVQQGMFHDWRRPIQRGAERRLRLLGVTVGLFGVPFFTILSSNVLITYKLRKMKGSVSKKEREITVSLIVVSVCFLITNFGIGSIVITTGGMPMDTLRQYLFKKFLNVVAVSDMKYEIFIVTVFLAPFFNTPKFTNFFQA